MLNGVSCYAEWCMNICEFPNAPSVVHDCLGVTSKRGDVYTPCTAWYLFL